MFSTTFTGTSPKSITGSMPIVPKPGARAIEDGIADTPAAPARRWGAFVPGTVLMLFTALLSALFFQPAPNPLPGEALLRVSACGLCGSELEAFKAKSPRRPPHPERVRGTSARPLAGG